MGRSVPTQRHIAVNSMTTKDRHGTAQHFQEEAVRIGEGELDCVVIDHFQFGALVDVKEGRAHRHQFGILVHVLIPEHDIIGREGFAIRPFNPIAQEERQLGLVIVKLPAFGQVGHDLGEFVGIPEDKTITTGYAMAVLAVARASKATAPGAAILADLGERLDDQQILTNGQPVGHGGQGASIDQFLEHGRFAKLTGEFINIGENIRAFNRADE